MVKETLAHLGLTLPAAATPAANYVSYITTENQLYVSGQIPMVNGELQGVGKVGKNITIDEAKEIAELCGLNILAQVDKALEGDWDRLVQCLRLGVFVHSTDDFVDQPQVANGVSDLMVAVLGERGKHTRAAVSTNQLPFGVAVEVDAIFAIK